MAWLTGHRSQRSFRDDLHRRVRAAADTLASHSADVLVVSHGGFIYYLSNELRRRGYLGPKLREPQCATLYVYHLETTRNGST